MANILFGTFKCLLMVIVFFHILIATLLTNLWARHPWGWAGRQLMILLAFGVLVTVLMLRTVGYIAAPFDLNIVDDPLFF